MNVKTAVACTAQTPCSFAVAGQRVNLPDRERTQFVGLLHRVEKCEYLPQLVRRVGVAPFQALVRGASPDENVIEVMLANPKPHVLVGQLDRQGAAFQRHPRRPDFLPVAGKGAADCFSARRIACQPVRGCRRAGRDNRSRNPRSRGGSLCGFVRGVVCFRICGRPRRD
jgi:hypothetical protein